MLYTAAKTVANYTDASIVIQPLPRGPRKVLVREGYFVRYLPSGHIAFVRDATLFVAPFDLSRLELTGPFAPVIDHISAYTGLGSALFAVSDTGTAVFASELATALTAPIVWLDRNGRTTPLRTTATSWSNPEFAPDGRRLALEIDGGKQSDIWVYDWERDTLTRATLESGDHWMPMWTPDARRIAFGWYPSGSAGNLYWRRADGGGEVQRLADSPNPQMRGTWHPSGKFLVFGELSRNTTMDLMLLPVDGDETNGWKPGKATPFLNTPAAEDWPAFSPDGRWIAYRSDESGRVQVYVRPFPGPGGQQQVSTDGGSFPVWSRVRKELLYATPDNRINVVSYAAEADSFAADKPRRWSDVQFSPRPTSRVIHGIERSFDLHPDGERVAIAPVPASQNRGKQDNVIFVFNFFDKLRRIAPATHR